MQPGKTLKELRVYKADLPIYENSSQISWAVINSLHV